MAAGGPYYCSFSESGEFRMVDGDGFDALSSGHKHSSGGDGGFGGGCGGGGGGGGGFGSGFSGDVRRKFGGGLFGGSGGGSSCASGPLGRALFRHSSEARTIRDAVQHEFERWLRTVLDAVDRRDECFEKDLRLIALRIEDRIRSQSVEGESSVEFVLRMFGDMDMTERWKETIYTMMGVPKTKHGYASEMSVMSAWTTNASSSSSSSSSSSLLTPTTIKPLPTSFVWKIVARIKERFVQRLEAELAAADYRVERVTNASDTMSPEHPSYTYTLKIAWD